MQRITQQIIETLADVYVTPAARISQQALEVLAEPVATPAARISQQVLEVLAETPEPWGNLHDLRDVEAGPDNQVLWKHPAVLLANWLGGVKVREAFATDVAKAGTAAEHRYGLAGKPFRTITADIRAASQASVRLLGDVLRRMAEAPFLYPLWHDWTTLSATANAGATTLSCDTTGHLFNNGMRVLIGIPGQSSYENLTYEIAHVEGCGPEALTLFSAIAGTWPAGTRVWPMIEAKLLPISEGTVLSDRAATAQIAVIEADGSWALEVRQQANTIAPGVYSYGGYPIFSFPMDWGKMSWGIVREVDINEVGLGYVTDTLGNRAARKLKSNVLLPRRDLVLQFLRFWESRCGRLFPFWLPLPFDEYTITQISGTTVKVSSVGATYDWNTRPYLFLRMRDGTWYVRQISAWSRASGSDTLTITEALPAITLSSIQRAGNCILARFNSDELVQHWTTPSVMSTQVEMLELITEASTSVANMPTIPSGRGLPTRWALESGARVLTQQVLETLAEVSASNKARLTQQVIEVLVEVA